MAQQVGRLRVVSHRMTIIAMKITTHLTFKGYNHVKSRYCNELYFHLKAYYSFN
jgi:hypothetical protein